MVTCQKCGKRPATTHIMQTIGGNTVELNLCQTCAAKLGYSGLSGFSVNELFGSLFGEGVQPKSKTPQVRCPSCGCTFQEISRTGKVGCAKCYEVFYNRLLPNLERIHGKVQHVGKLPAEADTALKAKREEEELQRKLREAVEKQDFEQAAVLRDRLKELERGQDDEGDK